MHCSKVTSGQKWLQEWNALKVFRKVFAISLRRSANSLEGHRETQLGDCDFRSNQKRRSVVPCRTYVNWIIISSKTHTLTHTHTTHHTWANMLSRRKTFAATWTQFNGRFLSYSLPRTFSLHIFRNLKAICVWRSRMENKEPTGASKGEKKT